MNNILVLDDVLDAANMIKRLLERRGYGVEAFTEEEEALHYLCHHAVQVAILDIRLRKMSGIAVLEKIKKHFPHIRVIMLTGYPTLETARRARQLGAFDYCLKPIDKKDLEDKVAKALAAV